MDHNLFEKRHKRMMTVNKLFIGFVVTLMVTSIGFSIYASKKTELVTVQVQDKESVTSSDADGNVESKYLVFTNVETFQCVDDLLHMKFNSSDIYGRLQKGQTYRLKVAGFRVPFLSMYRNIISIQR